MLILEIYRYYCVRRSTRYQVEAVGGGQLLLRCGAAGEGLVLMDGRGSQAGSRMRMNRGTNRAFKHVQAASGCGTWSVLCEIN